MTNYQRFGSADLQDLARRIRRDVLLMTSRGNSSHVGSALGIADIMAALYGNVLDVRPADPQWLNRDRFILSKGHAGAAVYAALAETGFFDASLLETHCSDGSQLSGHVSHKGVRGVDISTGSLGHGLAIGCGIALAAKWNSQRYRTFCLVSDGECNEGSVWEAIMFASHHGLDNLVCIVDCNGLQSLTSVAETLNMEPFGSKWEVFGWHAVHVDGHDISQLTEVLDTTPVDGKPSVVLANTVKGRGVSFMENQVLWHYRSPQGSELAAALSEVEAP